MKITGTVSDHSGEALSGVSIFIKGASSDTVSTDGNGSYIIQVRSNSDILKYTYKGMKTVEITADQSVIDVVLEKKPLIKTVLA